MFGGCKTLFDKIKGKKTAKKISSFFSENYDPLSDSMFSPKDDLKINTDSPEVLKFINDITLFLNDESRSEQLSYTMEKLHIKDLVKWACLIKEITENYDTNSNKYTSLFYNKITEADASYLSSFLSTNLIGEITSRTNNIKDDTTRAAYQKIVKRLDSSVAENDPEPGNPEPGNPAQKEIFQSTPSDKFIRKLRKILDSAYLPIKRYKPNPESDSKADITPADLEIYKNIASILPNDDKSFDNTYSKFVSKVGSSELIRRCILDENYRKKFSPKQLVKLQRYYDLSGESIDQHNEQDKIYKDMDQNILNEEIPNGAITFDPRYKNNKNISYISSEPIVNADGFTTLHDIGKDGNQQDIEKPPVIEAHTASNSGGSQLEITHCFFRVRATELDTDSVANENLNNKENSEKSIMKRALKRKSYSFGFYPNRGVFVSQSDGPKGSVFPGLLKDDCNHYSQIAVARVCDNQKILKLDKAVHKFTKENNYSLYFSNCTAFVAKVSKAIGFRDISKMFGSFIFTPNRAAKKIISSWMSGKYDDDSNTMFKAPSHKMRVYAGNESESGDEKFYSEKQGFFGNLKFKRNGDESIQNTISNGLRDWLARSVINMEDMKFEDNDDLSYDTIKKYLIDFVSYFYDDKPEQLIDYGKKLADVLASLKQLFSLADKNNCRKGNLKLVNYHKLIAKEQLNLLGEIFKNHNNYRGFLFVKFLIGRLDAGLIEMLILKSQGELVDEEYEGLEDSKDEKIYALRTNLTSLNKELDFNNTQMKQIKSRISEYAEEISNIKKNDMDYNELKKEYHNIIKDYNDSKLDYINSMHLYDIQALNALELGSYDEEYYEALSKYKGSENTFKEAKKIYKKKATEVQKTAGARKAAKKKSSELSVKLNENKELLKEITSKQMEIDKKVNDLNDQISNVDIEIKLLSDEKDRLKEGYNKSYADYKSKSLG